MLLLLQRSTLGGKNVANAATVDVAREATSIQNYVGDGPHPVDSADHDNRSRGVHCGGVLCTDRICLEHRCNDVLFLPDIKMVAASDTVGKTAAPMSRRSAIYLFRRVSFGTAFLC